MATARMIEITGTIPRGEVTGTIPRGAPTRPGRGDAPVDLVHLARQTFGSVDLEREVLGLFVQQGGLLTRALRSGPLGEQAALVHRLKGSARGIGATTVDRLCGEWEAADEAQGERARLAEAIEAAVADVAGFVNDLLGPIARER